MTAAIDKSLSWRGELQCNYSYSVYFQQYYSAEYEYTIWPTIRPE